MKLIFGSTLERLDISLTEIQGSESEVILDKMKKILEVATQDTIVIVDDRSIEFEALNGFPGPYAKDFIRKTGPKRIIEIARVFGTGAKTKCSLGVGYYMNGKPIYKIFSAESKCKVIVDAEPKNNRYISILGGIDSNIPYIDMTQEERNFDSSGNKAAVELKEFLIENKLI